MTISSERSCIFLFTDIEGSTQLWERYPASMPSVLSEHDGILEDLITQFGGVVVKHTGDGVFAVFENTNAISCALELQKIFQSKTWDEFGKLSIRVALHAGHAEMRGEDYFGIAINRTARILSSSWGGQTLITPEVVSRSDLPQQANLKDLGIHQLKDLGQVQQLFELQHPELLHADFPPIRTLSVQPHNLPRQATQFLGRENELTEIAAHLRDTPCRLLTLVGPGGIGKTRLAVQVSAEIIEAFPDGVYFVQLAPISSEEFLLSTIADALSFSFYGEDDPAKQLISYLGEKEMLIVLDNFEHVMQGAGFLVKILEAAPQVKLLVTSRERMQIHGEWVYRIYGLEVPSERRDKSLEDYSSVQLFLQGVRRVSADFEMREEDEAAISRICELVEGIPLGIELASAWVEMLSCKEIADEIEQNRDFLETSIRDIPERHRSLRAVFDYSWNLLSEDEREVFAKLSVFRGGFTREAARTIAAASLTQLTALVHKSLLRVPTSGRYEMLEVLRNYAAEKLQESGDVGLQVGSNHSQLYLKLLESSEDLLKGQHQKEALEKIGQEIENIREAWSFALKHGHNQLLSKGLNGLYLFYEMRSWFLEGEEIFGKLYTSLSENPESNSIDGAEGLLEAQALARQAGFSHRLGQSSKAQELLEQSLDRLNTGDCIKTEHALIMNNLGNLAYTQGDFDRAKEYHSDALESRIKLQETWGISTSLSNLGVVADRLGNQAEAKELFARSLKHRREIGDLFGIASSLNNLGVLAARMGEYDEARDLHHESLEIRRELGDRKGITESLNNLGVVADAIEDHLESRDLYNESLELSKEIGDKFSTARTLNNLGIVAYSLGEFEEALKKCEEGLALNRVIDNTSGIILSLSGIGNAATALQDYSRAQQCFREALKIAFERNHTTELMEVLAGHAIQMNQQGNYEVAFKLFALASEHPESDLNTQESCKHFMRELNEILPPPIKKRILDRLKLDRFDAIIESLLGEESA